MDALQATLAKFHKIWFGNAPGQGPEHWSDEGAELPDITLEELDEALKQYPERTGLTWEALHPKSLLFLPPESRKSMIDLMHLWEKDPSVVQAPFVDRLHPQKG